jgi:hypothetical protein
MERAMAQKSLGTTALDRLVRCTQDRLRFLVHVQKVKKSAGEMKEACMRHALQTTATLEGTELVSGNMKRKQQALAIKLVVSLNKEFTERLGNLQHYLGKRHLDPSHCSIFKSRSITSLI